MTFATVARLARVLPGVEATTNWAGKPTLKAGGSFMAGMASHASAEPGTLVVRCDVDDRARFIEDAPETYYITDYYEKYPLVLIRLSAVGEDALRDLLAVSWRMAMEKARRPAATTALGHEVRRPANARRRGSRRERQS